MPNKRGQPFLSPKRRALAEKLAAKKVATATTAAASTEEAPRSKTNRLHRDNATPADVLLVHQHKMAKKKVIRDQLGVALIKRGYDVLANLSSRHPNYGDHPRDAYD